MSRIGAFRALWLAVSRHSGGDVLGFGALIAATPRMIRQSLTGRYPGMDKRRVLLAGLGLVYVISPFDLIPEIPLMLLGLGDDAVVLAWTVGALVAEAEAFTRWERGELERVVQDGPIAPGSPRGNRTVVKGQVVDSEATAPPSPGAP